MCVLRAQRRFGALTQAAMTASLGRSLALVYRSDGKCPLPSRVEVLATVSLPVRRIALRAMWAPSDDRCRGLSVQCVLPIHGCRPPHVLARPCGYPASGSHWATPDCVHRAGLGWRSPDLRMWVPTSPAEHCVPFPLTPAPAHLSQFPDLSEPPAPPKAVRRSDVHPLLDSNQTFALVSGNAHGRTFAFCLKFRSGCVDLPVSQRRPAASPERAGGPSGSAMAADFVARNSGDYQSTATGSLGALHLRFTVTWPDRTKRARPFVSFADPQRSGRDIRSDSEPWRRDSSGASGHRHHVGIVIPSFDRSSEQPPPQFHRLAPARANGSPADTRPARRRASRTADGSARRRPRPRGYWPRPARWRRTGGSRAMSSPSFDGLLVLASCCPMAFTNAALMVVNVSTTRPEIGAGNTKPERGPRCALPAGRHRLARGACSASSSA